MEARETVVRVSACAVLWLCLVTVLGCRSDLKLYPKVLERRRVGQVCLCTVEIESTVHRPCELMAAFATTDSCRLNQVTMGSGKSLANYFRGPFTTDAGVVWQWNERERIRHEPFSGTIGLLISTEHQQACAYSDSLDRPHIPAPLKLSDILGEDRSADDVQLRFVVITKAQEVQLYTTLDRTISKEEASRWTAEIAERLGVGRRLSIFFNRRAAYFDGGDFPLFNPLLSQGEIVLDDAKRSRFMLCGDSGRMCLGSIDPD